MFPIFVLIVSNPDLDSRLNPSLYCSGVNPNLVNPTIVKRCKQTFCQLRDGLSQSIGRQHIPRHRLKVFAVVRCVACIATGGALLDIWGDHIPPIDIATKHARLVLTCLPLKCHSLLDCLSADPSYMAPSGLCVGQHNHDPFASCSWYLSTVIYAMYRRTKAFLLFITLSEPAHWYN